MSEAALDAGSDAVPLIAAWEQRLGNMLAAKTNDLAIVASDPSGGRGVVAEGRLGQAPAVLWTSEAAFRTLAPSSLVVDDLAALPGQLLAALVEASLEETIAEFAGALGLRFVLASARLGPMDGSISIGRSGEGAAGGTVLQLPTEALEVVLSALEARPPIDRPERDAAAFVRLAAEAGRMEVAASDIAALSSGDVLLPDGLLTGECDLATFDGTMIFGRAALDGSSAEMTNLWRSGVTADDWDDNVDDADVQGDSSNEGDFEDEEFAETEIGDGGADLPGAAVDVDGLEVTLRFVVGSTELSVADLRAVAVGSVIDLDDAPGEMVKVFAGNRCIARGGIGRIDDRIGVRITRIEGDRRV